MEKINSRPRPFDCMILTNADISEGHECQMTKKTKSHMGNLRNVVEALHAKDWFFTYMGTQVLMLV